jgi:hypothetical protein
MLTWLKVGSNKNMGIGKLTVIQLGRIVRLLHTDMKTRLKDESNKSKDTGKQTVIQ